MGACLAPPRKQPKWRVFCIALLCNVVIYELPYALTLARTGWTSLPPVMAVDQMLYLNLSSIQHVSADEVVNPWYGNAVLTSDVPHLRFAAAFVLFRFTRALLRSWTVAMLLWAATWAALSFWAAVFCLHSFFPDAKPGLVLLSSTGLMVLAPPLTYLAEVRHFWSLPQLLELHLPFVRFAIPQVIVPALLIYLGLQARALSGGSKSVLGLMALCQFGVCVGFPYFLPVLAIGTGLSILIAKSALSGIRLTWLSILGFGATCGFLDIGYLLLGDFRSSQGNVQFNPHLRPEMILPCMKPFMLVLALFAGLAMISRAAAGTKATVAGLALANALFGFSDVVFPPQAQILDHPYYLIALTMWLPLLVFLWAFLQHFESRAMSVALISMVVALSLWESFAIFKSNQTVNMIQAAALSEIKKLSLTGQDMVIAPAHSADDISSWIPLVSSARVLYTSDGENILSAADTRTVQPLRQSLYLSMAGMDLINLTRITADHSPDSLLNSLVQQGERGYERSPLLSDRLHARSLVRERLEPLLSTLQDDPTLPNSVFSSYKRIIVLDTSSEPLFVPTVFSRWMQIDHAYISNGIRIWICHARVS
jgi:hypothetical protein